MLLSPSSPKLPISYRWLLTNIGAVFAAASKRTSRGSVLGGEAEFPARRRATWPLRRGPISELLEDSDAVVYRDSSEPLKPLAARPRESPLSLNGGKKCEHGLQLLQQGVEFIKWWGKTVWILTRFMTSEGLSRSFQTGINSPKWYQRFNYFVKNSELMFSFC